LTGRTAAGFGGAKTPTPRDGWAWDDGESPSQIHRRDP
jgi:hypothetical protein